MSFSSHLHFWSSVVHIRLIAFQPGAMPFRYSNPLVCQAQKMVITGQTDRPQQSELYEHRSSQKISQFIVKFYRTDQNDEWRKWLNVYFEISIDRLFKTFPDNTILLLPQNRSFTFHETKLISFPPANDYILSKRSLHDLRTHIRLSPRSRNPGEIDASSNIF